VAETYQEDGRIAERQDTVRYIQKLAYEITASTFVPGVDADEISRRNRAVQILEIVEMDLLNRRHIEKAKP